MLIQFLNLKLMTSDIRLCTVACKINYFFIRRLINAQVMRLNAILFSKFANISGILTRFNSFDLPKSSR